MPREIVDPRRLSTLADKFPSEASIEAAAEVQDALGQPVETWSDQAFLVDDEGDYLVDDAGAILVADEEDVIDCQLYGTGGKEVRRSDQTVAIATHEAILKGYRSDVTVLHRIVVDGQAYGIVAVEQDSQQEATRLLLEVIS